MKKKYFKKIHCYLNEKGEFYPWPFPSEWNFALTAREIANEAIKRNLPNCENVFKFCKTSGRGRDWSYLYRQDWFMPLKSEMLKIEPYQEVEVEISAIPLNDTHCRRDAFDKFSPYGKVPGVYPVKIKYSGEFMFIELKKL